MKLLPLSFILVAAITCGNISADDHAADTDILQQKLAQQAQAIMALQAQLNSCRDAGNMADAGTASGAADEEATLSNRYQFQPATAPAAPRRAVGVYQQPSEPKLACADYSMHYFSRHPAMAAVCGVNKNAQQEDAPANAPAETSATRVPTSGLPARP